ncbi:MAG: hypothetical protein PHT75_00305 [Bacilli bacterium]|nr:hypothetical protein [Bacilli bacterium]MDD3304564.1 hypothetical protein [Bacilli bacterium]MDD4053820.1 hypothetical protein [Bacilli bacterium]MDD4411313.1 hypothetical protein [Bacilli bacterium]
MSDPTSKMPERYITREQAITDIIESVALEEAALSHILKAEGDKIHKFLEKARCPGDLLLINKSVQSMISVITVLQAVLHAKIELFACDNNDYEYEEY